MAKSTKNTTTRAQAAKAYAQDKYARAAEVAKSRPVVEAAKVTGIALGGATVLGASYALFATVANKAFAAMN